MLFKVFVTNSDGSTEVKTLEQAVITSIKLTADATRIELLNGSEIAGQTIFTRSNSSTGPVANTTLAADADGYAVTEGNRMANANYRLITTVGA